MNGVLSRYIAILVLGPLFAACSIAPAWAQDSSEAFPDVNMEVDFDMDEFEGFGDEDFAGNQLSPDEAAAIAAASMIMLVVIGIFAVLGILITVFVAYLMMDALNAVPAEYQQLSPGVPWLLLVPLVNIVVLFLVFIKVPDSLSSYLNAMGDQSQGDCGRSNGLIGAILYILGCTFPIGLVLLVMSIMKIGQAKVAARSLAQV